jgi:hypothetical protein
LAPGQELAIDLLLPATGEIAGRVLDDNDGPVAEAWVFLVGREYYLGTLRYSFRTSVMTDDQGKYRIADGPVPDTPYLLLARKRSLRLPAISNAPADPESRRRVLAQTFHSRLGHLTPPRRLSLRPAPPYHQGGNLLRQFGPCPQVRRLTRRVHNRVSGQSRPRETCHVG